MKPKRESEVLVVGGGPVGLFAALCMARREIDVELLDKDWIGSAHSYALALHPASLRLLDEAGLAQELIDQGHRVERVAFYRGDERLAELELQRLQGAFPFVLVLPQSALEQALERRLREHKVRILWNHQALALTPDDGGVDAEIGKMDKVSMGYPVARTEWVIHKRFRTRSALVLGADGYHSFVRKSLGLKYADLGGAETYCVFEFRTTEDLGDEVRIVLHEGTTSVLWPMKDGRGRWSFQVDPAARPELNDQTLRSLLSQRAPWFKSAPAEVFWATTTHFERRLAERFGRGRVWLAGDAAHITGPAGVQSMNVGLREGHELAAGFHEVLRGDGAPERLESYDAQRRAEWQGLLGLEGRLTSTAAAPAWAGEQAARIVAALPASGSELAALLEPLGLQLT